MGGERRPLVSGQARRGPTRNPESHSGRRDWYVMTEEDYEGMAGSFIPTDSQVLQGRSNKAEKSMTCPPIVVSDNNRHRFPWEDKPTVVMKITKRKRCKMLDQGSPSEGGGHSRDSWDEAEHSERRQHLGDKAPAAGSRTQ